MKRLNSPGIVLNTHLDGQVNEVLIGETQQLKKKMDILGKKIRNDMNYIINSTLNVGSFVYRTN